MTRKDAVQSSVEDNDRRSVRVFADVLEHADPATTQRYYGAQKKVNRVFAEALDVVPEESE